MEYLIVFIEGIITFISPCILPMLPIYISYFAGDIEEGKKGKTIINSIGFVIGFTIIFTLLGALAGTFGMFIKKYQTIFNIIGGSILIIFGLNYMGILSIGFIEKTKKIQVDIKSFKFFSTIVFGMIFAIGWTPCVGTFLGSALMIAASSSGVLKGTIMLLIYSLGLGIPFIIAALIMDELKNIKNKQRVIEFMLGLDRNEIALKKSSLKTLLKSKEKEWSKTNQIINSFSKDYYLEFSKDYTDYKNFLEKELIEININTVEKTISLNNYIKQKNEELNHIKSNNFYKKESENNNLEEYSTKIKELQEQIIILQNKERKYHEKRIKLKLQRNNIAEELKKIDYEKKVFKDIRRLENSGGKNGVELLSCPYCNNKLSENTFSKEVYTMDVDENIKFLDEKLKLLLITEKVLVEEFSELIGKESVIKTELKLKLKELEILNTNLPKISLQKELYYKEFKIEEELEKIIKVNSELRKIFIEKKELANSINEIRKNLEKLPKDDISEMTKEKLKLFEKTIKEYLKIFNFESIEISRIHISEENYFPRVENFDIRMHISASDFIRLQWAYYISLMELSNLSKKILIFDEPGQQNIDFDSIEKLLLVLKEKKDIQSLVSYAISKQTRFKVIKFLKENKINHILIKGKSIKKISE